MSGRRPGTVRVASGKRRKVLLQRKSKVARINPKNLKAKEKRAKQMLKKEQAKFPPSRKFEPDENLPPVPQRKAGALTPAQKREIERKVLQAVSMAEGSNRPTDSASGSMAVAPVRGRRKFFDPEEDPSAQRKIRRTEGVMEDLDQSGPRFKARRKERRVSGRHRVVKQPNPVDVDLANTPKGVVPAEAVRTASTNPGLAMRTAQVNVPGRAAKDIMNPPGAMGRRDVLMHRTGGAVTGNPHPIGGAPLSRLTANIRYKMQSAGQKMAPEVQRATAEAVSDQMTGELPVADPTNYIFDRQLGERFRIPDGPQVRAKPKPSLRGGRRLMPGQSIGRGTPSVGTKSKGAKKRRISAHGKVA